MEAAHLILAGLGAAVQLVLLALLINLSRAMTRLALAICAVLACLALGAMALSFVKWSEIPTPVEVYLEGNAQPEQIASSDGFGPSVAAPARPVLSAIKARLVRYAFEELDGAFKINALYETQGGLISQRRLTALAQPWEARGWRTTPEHAIDARKVTTELLELVGPVLDTQNGDRES